MKILEVNLPKRVLKDGVGIIVYYLFLFILVWIEVRFGVSNAEEWLFYLGSGGLLIFLFLGHFRDIETYKLINFALTLIVAIAVIFLGIVLSVNFKFLIGGSI